MANPQAAAQASQSRWGPALHGRNFNRVATDYWNDAGTALTQDLQTLRTSHNGLAKAAAKTLDLATFGLTQSPYFTALAGNPAGGTAHAVTNAGKRWGPALASIAAVGGSQAFGVEDPLERVKNDYRHDPAGTLAEDLSVVATIAGGAAGAARIAGRLSRAGPELAPEPPPGNAPAHTPTGTSASSAGPGPLTRQLGDNSAAIAENIQNKYGMPIKDQRSFQGFANERDLIIDVRPSNLASLPDRLNKTGLPKSSEIKVKTINKYDEMLNPEIRGQSGRAGYFDPGEPPQRGNLAEPEWSNLDARYTQRKGEYSTYQEKMIKLSSSGDIKIERGVVYGKAPDGTWMPYVADNDIYAIRHRNGDLVSNAEHDSFIHRMIERNMGEP